MNFNEKTMGALLKYKCNYCNAEFQPKKRFVQKYCCGSCRVMACRDRKAGNIRGIKPSLKKRVSNIQILEKINHYQRRNKKQLDTIKKHIHYIEIGVLIKIIYDWYQNTKRNERENERGNLKELLQLLIKQNPSIKSDFENIAKSDPKYREMLNNIL